MLTFNLKTDCFTDRDLCIPVMKNITEIFFKDFFRRYHSKVALGYIKLHEIFKNVLKQNLKLNTHFVERAIFH